LGSCGPRRQYSRTVLTFIWKIPASWFVLSPKWSAQRNHSCKKTHLIRCVRYRWKLDVSKQSANVALMNVKVPKVITYSIPCKCRARLDAGENASSILYLTYLCLNVRPMFNSTPLF
jgi:hypothetical protein